MTYNDKISTVNREPLNVVRIDFDTRITGDFEYTCDGSAPPSSPPMWPCVRNIDWIPQRTATEGGLGAFGEVIVTFQDFNYGENGTYFGRLLANNRYFLDRSLYIWSGFWSRGESFDLADFQQRQYFIRDITGPDINGVVRIRAVDIMTQTKEALVPASSNGVLETNLGASTTGTRDITDNTGFSSGYAIIGDEIIAYSGVSGSDSIVITGRGEDGTTAEHHDPGDSVRHIYQTTGNVVDVIRSIIENFTDIDHASYIDDSAWNSERDNFLSGENVEVWIDEPTAVSKVIDDLCKQTYVNVFWDDLNQKIALKAIGPTLSSVATWNDHSNILDQRAIVKRPQKNIFTDLWFYYDKIDKTGSDTDAKNYRSLFIYNDSDIETGLGTSKVKKIYGSYIPGTGSATASKVASRFISQHRNPLDVTITVDVKDQVNVDAGDAINLSTDMIQGTDGMPAVTQMRIIEKCPKKNSRWQYRMIFAGVEQGARYGVIAPNGTPDYLASTDEQREKYGFICDNDNEMSNGDEPYLIV